MELNYQSEDQVRYCIKCGFEGMVAIEKLTGCAMTFIKGQWFVGRGLNLKPIRQDQLEKIPACPQCGQVGLEKRISQLPSTVISPKDNSTYKAVTRLQQGLYHDSRRSLKISREVNREMKNQLIKNIKHAGATDVQ